MNNFIPQVIWMTGLSGAGKTTLSQALLKVMRQKGIPVEHLDGDTIRNFFPQTGFDRISRDDHVKKMGFLSSILERNGITVICSFISPYEKARKFVRNICKNFVEVYLSTSIEDCEKRDIKGLYQKARNGKIMNFTGISDPYEEPSSAEIVIDTGKQKVHESLKILLNYLDIQMEDSE